MGRKDLLRCSCVHCRHPLELGGIYFFVNALMNVASWFVAAALYSLYFSAPATELAHCVNASTSESIFKYSANLTEANLTGPASAFAGNRTDAVTKCYIPPTQVPTCT